MKKIVSVATVLLLLLGVKVNAQWVNEGAWPNASYLGQNHAMDVDGEGKVWVSNYSSDTTIGGASYRTIKVFNPDGSQASFSPIIAVQGNGINDSLKAATLGMRRDHNGDMLLVTGTSTVQYLYRFNHQTGAAMNKVEIGYESSTPIAPTVDDQGNIYIGPVFPAFPIKIYDADFNYIGDAVTSTTGFSRTLLVSSDGLTLYHPVYSTNTIMIYTRPDEFSEFDSTGAIVGPACESIAWNPATGKLWFSGGSYFNLPTDPKYTPNTWYEYDFTANDVTDSLKWEFTTPQSPDERPRAIAFSLDGKTAYIGCFGQTGYPLIQKVVNTSVDVKPDPNTTVTNYDLSQNYPNPFNPTTEIKFTVAKEGFVTLKVYDVLGKEVANLVSEQMPAGAYTVDFNASDLSSGTYIYTLSVNGVSISKKMMLLK